MRLRLLLLFLPVLLGACSKTATPVQVDFVGATTLTSSNKVVNPNDTLTTRTYAVGNDNALTHLRVTVTYNRGLTPIVYPVPIVGYDVTTGPDAQTITYLDSTLVLASGPNGPRGGDILYQNQFSARATSGTEIWQYTATDNAKQSATRAYQLTVRKPDSAALFHSYTTIIQPPANAATTPHAVLDRARVYLNLRYGLLLPRYSVINRENTLVNNQQLVDLICTARSAGIALEAPADPAYQSAQTSNRWPTRRTTKLLQTTLTPIDFSSATLTTDFNTVFANGQPFQPTTATYSTSTGPLTANQVVAFKTTEGYTGLILVVSVLPGTVPVLTCMVKVAKSL